MDKAELAICLQRYYGMLVIRLKIRVVARVYELLDFISSTE